MRDEYVRRIAELQAKYRLVPSRGPFQFACDGNPANEVVVTHFATEPPTLIAEMTRRSGYRSYQVCAGDEVLGVLYVHTRPIGAPFLTYAGRVPGRQSKRIQTLIERGFLAPDTSPETCMLMYGTLEDGLFEGWEKPPESVTGDKGERPVIPIGCFR